MLKNEAFKKYSANFAFLVGNAYLGGYFEYMLFQ